MKRLLLVLCAGLLLNVHVFAQYEDEDDYGYEDEAGASASINLSATNSGEEGHSVQKLTLPNNQPIYLYFYNTVQNPNAPEPQASSPPPAQTAQPPVTSYYPSTPEPVIEYRYVPGPSTPPPPDPIYIQPPPPPPQPQIEYVYIQPPAPPPPQIEYVYIQPPAPPAPQIEYVYIQPPAPPPPQIEYLPPPQVEYIPPPRVEPVYIQQPAQIRVLPKLPNPNSSKLYSLQVGSYASNNTAEVAAQRIRSAGLQAVVENYNSLKRVSVPGVRASNAASIVQMLEMLGFQEVWVRE